MEECKKYCNAKHFSSNQLFSIFFSKDVTFTKFLLKCDSKFPYVISTLRLTHKIFRQINSGNSFSKTVTFTKFLAQIRECEFNFRNFHCVDCHSAQSVLYSHCFSQIFRGINVILLSQYSSTNSVVQNA